MHGAWRYWTDCVTGLRHWRWFSRVGRPLRATVYPCTKAAIVGAPLLAGPAATPLVVLPYVPGPPPMLYLPGSLPPVGEVFATPPSFYPPPFAAPLPPVVLAPAGPDVFAVLPPPSVTFPPLPGTPPRPWEIGPLPTPFAVVQGEQPPPTRVPEPSSIWLLGALIGAAFWERWTMPREDQA